MAGVDRDGGGDRRPVQEEQARRAAGEAGALRGAAPAREGAGLRGVLRRCRAEGRVAEMQG
eukprot:481592-Prymnesium_polylepis.1